MSEIINVIEFEGFFDDLINSVYRKRNINSKYAIVPKEENSINVYAFAFYQFSRLKSIVLPKGIKYISNWTFDGCSSLESIVLPEGLEAIGYQSFGNCFSLESITFPESLKLIEECAFYGCSKLKKVVIPKGIEEIGEDAFRYCNDLESIVVPKRFRRDIYHIFGKDESIATFI